MEGSQVRPGKESSLSTQLPTNILTELPAKLESGEGSVGERRRLVDHYLCPDTGRGQCRLAGPRQPGRGAARGGR